jgi:hypothetical protein
LFFFLLEKSCIEFLVNFGGLSVTMLTNLTRKRRQLVPGNQ